MNKTTLLMVRILGAIAILSAGLTLVPSSMQQASAIGEEDGGDTNFSF